MNSDILQARFLSRTPTAITVNTPVPIASSININSDMRQFAGTFDLQMEFSLNQAFNVKSHDFVEFYFMNNGSEFQVFAGFLEDMVSEKSSSGFSLKANGRDFLGHLMTIPFKTQTKATVAFLDFLATTTNGTYLQNYVNYKGYGRQVIDRGAYKGNITALTDLNRKRAAFIQDFADKALNLLYQNRLGQLEAYGVDDPVTPDIGVLTTVPGKSNVISIQQRQCFSKVMSELTVFWAASEANLGYEQVSSPRFVNPDPRIAHIFQPENRVFSSDDIATLAGSVTPDQRISQQAKSIIRQSNQNLNMAVVNVNQPYFVDASGTQIPFELRQVYRVIDIDAGLNSEMTLAGINYQQGSDALNIQLAFVEDGTLI